MSASAEVGGMEFDWVAMDSNENIALFATAGAGFVPPLVLSHIDEYDAISVSLPASNWGSEKLWDSYAALGLWVYDWKLLDGPYLRVRVPTHEMTDALRRRLFGISSLPRFELEFRSSEIVTAMQEVQ